MNYKDKTFEIDDIQVKFKNGILLYWIVFIPIVSFTKGDIFTALFSLLGIIIAFFILKFVIPFYFKSTIELSDIEFVQAQIWDESIDKKRNFWGVGLFKYHFPTGLNKKANPKVIFVHIKDRKGAVGFVPENMDNLIAVLKERGVKVIEQFS